MRHRYRTIGLAIATIVLLSGCSWSNTFQLLLTVTSADDKQPVGGVAAVLDTLGAVEERKQQLDAGSPIGTTDAAGQLRHNFTISGYTSNSGPWYLKLQKEGFEPLIIDISPKRSVNEREVPLPVTAEMKPIAKKP